MTHEEWTWKIILGAAITIASAAVLILGSMHRQPAEAAYPNGRGIEGVDPLPIPHSHHARACLMANGQIYGRHRTTAVQGAGLGNARQAWRSMGCAALFGIADGGQGEG